ncbi:MAG: PDR/VanB family oxidoreductase [Nocardioides sp.]
MTQTTETVVTEFEADVIVGEVRRVATDVVELTLTQPDGSALPPWTPGAHIDLILGPDLVRQYSLCGTPADLTSYRVAVLLAPDSRGGSRRVHELQAGDPLRIRGPRNHFPLVAAEHYLFVAGGIGITPMLPMIAAADAAGTPWSLHYGGRSLASMAYREALADHGDRVHFVPQDELGILNLPEILGNPAPGTQIYTCGPEPLLAAMEAGVSADGAGWPSGALHLERFAAKEIDTGSDTAFEVVLSRSGTTITVGATETLFDAMRTAGVPVLGSCLEGICGTCETEVLEGEVDHRDSILDEDEQEANDCMMVCVSRAKSARLVLDA